MTLVQLKYAVTLEKVKNYAIAATELLIAQPTLSLQIQKLEKSIGISIFDRTTNPISVTNEGKEFLKQVRVVLAESEKLEYMFSQKGDSIAGDLRIGIIPTVSSSLLIKILPIINSKFPDLNLRIFELPTNQIIQKLENNEIDAGILATPLENKKIKEYPLYYEPFRVYIPSSIKIKSKEMSIEDLQNYEMIVLGEEHCFRSQALKVCKNKSYGRIEAGSFETIKKLVDNNLGLNTITPLRRSNKQKSTQGLKRSNSRKRDKPGNESILLQNEYTQSN
jgi:LysR family hydrogen peroxide-inducible transcriptional activator